ncbi:MAG: sigma-54 dependent transcriptional regulator [Reichenbachiella sp.]|uniref:sigma-54-dependent transcriptional regulator n=1 Tax=Reichenbachiella sp. TaxID=2184521 RepID=UPI003297FD34
MESLPTFQDGNILIVDDDAGILTSAQLFLKQYYKKVYVELNPGKIQSQFKKHEVSIVLLDMNFQKGKNDGEDGFKYLQQILDTQPQTQVIFMTAYGDIDMAVKALKNGAIDFVTKPWKNEKFLTTVETANKLAQNLRQLEELKNSRQYQSEEQAREIEGFIGGATSFFKAKATMEKVAASEANVLLLGENGTGKGLAAKFIHQNSDRNERPMITIDMGALSETLIDSELFGHEKGAFTDASQQKKGRLELAHRGTLFLDEIGNLSLPAQAKLLSVLQNKRFSRLGSNNEINIDVRLICATNIPLYDMVEQGRFRQDLLYRINTVEVMMPNLTDRISDIPLLVTYYLSAFKNKYGKHNLSISEEEFEKLKRMNWPGNIRELQHATERAVILSETDQLLASDFQNTRASEKQMSEPTSLNLKKVEISYIEKAMALHEGNITHAAKELGIDRLALHRRLEKYGLQ